MRKTVLMVFAALAVCFSIPSDTGAAGSGWEQLKWRTNKAAVRGTLDSLTANTAGGSDFANVDTTVAFSTGNLDWNAATTTAVTNQPWAKLFLYTDATAIAGDSIYVAIDFGAGGDNWSQGQFAGYVSAVASEKLIGIVLMADGDLVNNVHRAPLVRFRVAGDAGGVKNVNLRAGISYPRAN